jgi:NitT/TauT family transport system ATP-binding protein/nitrate/nitrite transport system substrate-binding protein
MTNIVPFASRKSSHRLKLRIGLLKLTDAAPVIAAHELGFFADEGLNVELSIEPSWANIADKLAYGFLDAAVIVPPLAFAITLGLRGAMRRLVIPLSLSLGGNTVTLETSLAESISRGAEGSREALTAARALSKLLPHRSGERPTFGVVHAFSTHNLLLRYWLAAGGIDPDRDVTLTVIPPARMVEALEKGQIAGFCAGAPWGAVAERKGLAKTITTSHGIWRNAPEKALAFCESWADQNPETLQSALRALLRSTRFCDEPENAPMIAALLSEPRYLGVEADLITTSLPTGQSAADSGAHSRASIFFRNAANFPWRSHALWFLREMKRWGFLHSGLDLRAIATSVYRPDLYTQAAMALKISAPLNDLKAEGEHAGPWRVEGTLGPILMAADQFCDGLVFDPAALIEAPQHSVVPH